MKLQEAVKKETGNIALGTGVGVLIMFVVFFVLHMVIPKDWTPFNYNVPFDYRVILGGIGGFLVAVTVQKVASMEDEKMARAQMGVSYRNRVLLQLLWGILAIVLPVFNAAAGLIPLFIPSLYIKLRGIFSAGKGG